MYLCLYFHVCISCLLRSVVLASLSSIPGDTSTLTFVIQEVGNCAGERTTATTAFMNAVLLLTSWVVCRAAKLGEEVPLSVLADAGICGYIASTATPVRSTCWNFNTRACLC